MERTLLADDLAFDADRLLDEDRAFVREPLLLLA